MTKHFITFLIVTTLLNFCPSKYVEEPKCSWKLAARYWNCLNVAHDVNWDSASCVAQWLPTCAWKPRVFSSSPAALAMCMGELSAVIIIPVNREYSWRSAYSHSFRKPTVIPGARDWLWFSCEIAHCGKSLFSVFEEFVASIRKILILAGRLGTRISFYKV